MPTKNRKNNKNKQKQQSIQGISGQGGYYTDKVVPFMRKIVPNGSFARAGKSVGGVLGSTYGLGSPAAMVGQYLGGRLAQISGFGKYTVSRNTIAKGGTALSEGEEIPAFAVSGHETRVVHREYIGDIAVPASPLDFVNTAYSINAANSSTFPWLAPIAANYQQYRFNGLVFEFKTMSSDITAGGALGTVIMATNYDANNQPFPSKMVMENSQYAISAKPSRSQIHAVECDPNQVANNLYYCRNNTQDVNMASDVRFYDMGTFQLATSGLPGVAGVQLGELWVSYDVSLLKPEIASPMGSGTESATAQGVISVASVWGTLAPTYVGAQLYTASGATMTILYPGKYLMVQQATGTSLQIPTLTGTATTSLVVTSGPRPGTITNLSTVYRVTVTKPNQTVVTNHAGSGTVTGFYALLSAVGSFEV